MTYDPFLCAISVDSGLKMLFLLALQIIMQTTQSEDIPLNC
jgi:hypothetical protein